MNKKILILIIVLILVGIGALFILQKPAFPEQPLGRCGDGVCDAKEQNNPRLCPKDCKKPKPPINKNNQINNQTVNKIQTNQTTEKFGDSPFGLMDPFTLRPELMDVIDHSSREDYRVKYMEWADGHVQNIGAKWSKVAAEHIIWGRIEPELGKGYNWDNLDKALGDVFQSGEQNFIGVIVPAMPSRKQYDFADPSVQEQFKNFVKAIVERYDGDSDFDNATSFPDSSIKIKYWQADNEVFRRNWIGLGGTTATYATFLKLLSEGAKEADPEAKIVFGSQIIVPKTIDKNDYSNIGEVIAILKDKKIFDFADVHYWPMNKNQYKMPISDLRKILDDNGYEYVKFVSLEHATIMNKNNQNPAWKNSSREQSEKDQATFLIKSYAYNLANGFSLILWSPFVDFSNYGGGKPCDDVFDYMGLISDGKCINANDAGIPRLSYYTYKKMTEILEGSDWDNIQAIQEAGGIYIYKFTKGGKPIWVVWNDNSKSQTVILNVGSIDSVKITEAVPKYELGKDVSDYSSVFNTETKSVSGGSVSITLGDKPVFVEEK
ncbi:MAG: hypothetical protein Q8L26_05365 [Candidatus Omnitrophota bacterium]|nr:hypothetical protein [Candidatus Omnitrophota bacterium]